MQQKHIKFNFSLHFGSFGGHLGAMLGPLGAILGPLGAILDLLGKILGPLCAIWDFLGTSWDLLEAILAPLEPSWSLLVHSEASRDAPFGCHFAHFGSILGWCWFHFRIVFVVFKIIFDSTCVLRFPGLGWCFCVCIVDARPEGWSFRFVVDLSFVRFIAFLPYHLPAPFRAHRSLATLTLLVHLWSWPRFSQSPRRAREA